jgi:pimeloyl-ACP methyl ester carboxylesterase
MPDLPSHRERSAGRPADVQEVQAAVDAAVPPVAVAGWSYGGAIISDLTGTSRADRLVYVGSYPEPLEAGSGDEPAHLSGLPGLLFHDDMTVELDTDWWLSTPEVAAWPEEVVRHLRENRRRPITRSAWMAAPSAEAWRTVPSTILIGRCDQFIPAELQQQLSMQFQDVRLVDGDHFLPLLHPEVVAEVIAQALATTSTQHHDTSQS